MKEGGGGGGGEGRNVSLTFFPTHSPLFYSRHFSRGVCSLLRKRAETLATQANRSQARLLLTKRTSFSWTIVCPSFDFGKLPKVLRNNSLHSETLRRLHTRFGRSDF